MKDSVCEDSELIKGFIKIILETSIGIKNLKTVINLHVNKHFGIFKLYLSSIRFSNSTFYDLQSMTFVKVSFNF